MDCRVPGSSVHEISQARILERVFIFFTRDLPNPGIKPGSPALQADSLPLSPQGAVKDAEHNPNAQLTIILIDPASSSSTFLVHFRILLLTPLVGGLCVCTWRKASTAGKVCFSSPKMFSNFFFLALSALCCLPQIYFWWARKKGRGYWADIQNIFFG